MGVLSKGTDFTNGDQVTDTSLDNLVDNATFTTSAVDEVSTDIGGSGSIIVKDGGITTGKLATSTGAGDGVTTAKIATAAVTAAKLGTNAVTTVKILDDNVTTAKILDANVTTAKIADANVTKAKIENLTDYTVLGNVSGGAAAPAEVTILDEDTLVTDSATALATQQSIKAYVDASGTSSFTTTNSASSGYQVFGNGLKMAWGAIAADGLPADGTVVTFPVGVGFTVAPSVQVTYNSHNAGTFAAGAELVTTTQFTLNTSYTDYNPHYFAIGH